VVCAACVCRLRGQETARLHSAFLAEHLTGRDEAATEEYMRVHGISAARIERSARMGQWARQAASLALAHGPFGTVAHARRGPAPSGMRQGVA